jgi:hypothetical protein
LGNSLSTSLLKKIILLNFTKLYGIRFKIGKLTRYEMKLASLFERKYRSELWNFKGIYEKCVEGSSFTEALHFG